MAWNESALNQLKTDWNAGKPAGVIARHLGPGYTRTTVEQQAGRLGLKPRAAAPPARAGGAIPSQRESVQAASAYLNSHVANGPRFAALTDDELAPTIADVVAYGCKWPIGEVGTEGFGFCGRQTPTRRATFCAHHATIGTLATSAEADRRFFCSALKAADKQAPAA